MKLAYTMAPGRGDTDLILASLAATLAARGLICGGTVQINTERADSGPCDMDVKVLPDGPVLRISQELGRAAAGCRLNPDALETSVALASARLDAGADIIMINKFGKHEYKLAQYGITKEQLDTMFERYLSRYDVAREG